MVESRNANQDPDNSASPAQYAWPNTASLSGISMAAWPQVSPRSGPPPRGSKEPALNEAAAFRLTAPHLDAIERL